MSDSKTSDMSPAENATANLEAPRKTATCPKCGAESKNSAPFCPQCGTEYGTPSKSATAELDTVGSSPTTKAQDERFCASCGEVVKIAAEICPKCGVRQERQSGIRGFLGGYKTSLCNKISAAKSAIKEEQSMVTGISMPHKVLAILIAATGGLFGLTGLGSIVAGRKKAGMSMLGIPIVLFCIMLSCYAATVFSLVASIVVIGIPFLLFFGALCIPLTLMFCSSYYGFWVADVVLCCKAK